MIEFALQDLFAAAKTTWVSSVHGSKELQRSVSSISTDTRELPPGSLFVGLSGPNFNGADFVHAALEAGASAALVQAPKADAPRVLDELKGLSERFVAPVAVCADTRAALGSMGRLVRRASTAKAVAITGSSGKTSTKAILAHMLRAGYRDAGSAVVASPKSFNNYVGVPRTLMLTERSTEFLVLEVGTNGPGEIEDLAAIAEADVAMITSIGRAHLEGLGSVEGIAREKGMLLKALDPTREGAVAILNADCAMLPVLKGFVPEGVDVLTFGCGAARRAAGEGRPSEGRPSEGRLSVWAHDVRATTRGTECQLSIHPSLTPGQRIEGRNVVIPLLGDHAAANVAASLAAVLAIGGNLEAALASIATLEAEPHRLQPMLAGGVLVIDDAYNANPESMAAAVRTLAGLERSAASPSPSESPSESPLGAGRGAARSPRRVLVAGAMGELGPRRLELHREVGEVAGANGVDALHLAGEAHDADALAAMAEGAVAAGLAPDSVFVHSSVSEAVAALTSPLTGLAGGDVCLVKASRAARLERVVTALTDHFSVAETAHDPSDFGDFHPGGPSGPRRPERPGAPT